MRAPGKELTFSLVRERRGQDKVYEVTRCLNLVVRVDKQRESVMPG